MKASSVPPLLHASRSSWLAFVAVSAFALLLPAPSAQASIAYGSINNFDTVNDTGHEAHGFEIELDDCHSTDVTYTYNYNHYGVPEITEDNSVAGHPKVFIRWQSKKNADGTWAAYTAIPSGPIAPTDGHMFTNPAVNFGGEHFGVGYNIQPSAVLYNWLIDSGSGTLVNGGAVQVSTPTFTYFPPVGVAAAQVQAVIAPPPPPAPPVLEFGKAVWVKEIKTTTHNPEKIKLRELVSADSDHPEKKNWKKGEPDEVEVEWRILQKKTSAADGGVNNKVPAAPEALPNGDEVVTRRYEFYKYVGPLDAETGEAMGDAVGADGSHGTGSRTYADHFDGALGEWVTVTTDMSTKVIVGDFTGSQMAAVDVSEPLGLIDHVGEGNVNKAIAPRKVIIEGPLPFVAAQDGVVPPGLTFDATTGILSGTPTTSGTYQFSVAASDGMSPDVAKNYTMMIAAAGAALPAASLLDTTSSPVGAGMTTGDGSYAVGDNATVTATPVAGYLFLNWTDNGVIVSSEPSYTLAMDVNHSLVANFVPDVVQWTFSTSALPVAGGTVTGDGVVDDGSSVTLVATPSAGYAFTNWTEGGAQVSTSASYTFMASANRTLVANFTATPTYAVATSAFPVTAGTTTGDGNIVSGASATVVATANAGYAFSKWTVGGAQVSTSASYTFTVTASKTLIAVFVPTGSAATITTSASPIAGGSTSGSGSYATGDSATVLATPNAGYTFSKWKEGGTTVSNSPSYTFTVAGNRTLVASFNQFFTVTASASPVAAGTTEMDSASYKPDDTAKAFAYPGAGYEFVNWTEGGAAVSSVTPYSFKVTANRTLVANFRLIGGVSITASSAPIAGGTISGAGSYMIGDNVTVTATPNAGYTFTNWKEGAAVVSNSAIYSFTASADRALTANFVQGYTIGTDVSPALAGTTSGGGAINAGISTTLTAVANAGYTFLNWTNSAGTVVSSSTSYTFTPAADDTFTANFQAPAAGIRFDFDAGTPVLALHQPVPLTQTVAGITASFSSTNANPPTVENATSTGQGLASFSGKYLAPSNDVGTVVEISFDQPVSGIELKFATMEPANFAVTSDVQLTAFDTSSGTEVSVGTAIAHGTVVAGDSLPSGTLTFNSAGQTFDRVRIQLPAQPLGATKFFIDDITVSPGGSTGGTMTLANPNWNITLTDFGYSDFLLDNTPGFEGREYLSGEWGSAIGYTRNGTTVSPQWMEPNFLFPDWQTNSNFTVVQGIHLVGTNLDGLPIAESVITNNDLEITLRFEMVDTVIGTPMGVTAASSANAPKSINSNRYVLSQTFTVKNISGSTLSNVQLFQFLHGFTSQRGVYDNHSYPGKLSNYQYDATLAGVDATSIGDQSSASGLEDYIGFHSKVAPTAYEIGSYGTEGNGIDDHVTGKPSDGVHLSIEDNWQSAPFLSRKNRDYFAPASRWIGSGQRWELGSIANGQSVNFDIVLSLLTGTTVKMTGGGGNTHPGSGSCNGGSTHVGGADFNFDDIDTEGTFFGEYSVADANELAEREQDGEFALPTFDTPGGTQLWNLNYTGTHTGGIHLTFHYDPALLPAGYDQSKLTIRHYTNGAWEQLVGKVDTAKHTITVTAGSLSPFMLATPTANAYPQIQTTTLGGNTLQLNWTSDTTGWVLEESTDLVTWTPSALGITTVGNISTVNVTGVVGQRFFRLTHP